MFALSLHLASFLIPIPRAWLDLLKVRLPLQYVALFLFACIFFEAKLRELILLIITTILDIKICM
jgi:hypothetical protein